MAADSVEREIFIEASAEVVWGVITEPEQISRYLKEHEHGWERHLGEMLDYVAREPRRSAG